MTSATASLLGYCSLFARACCEWLKNMTSFVNTCVFLTTTKKTLLPWKSQKLIIRLLITLCPLYDRRFHQDQEKELRIRTLSSWPKDSLDPVDPNLLIQPVLASFGRFLKYCVTCSSNDLNATIPLLTNRMHLNI